MVALTESVRASVQIMELAAASVKRGALEPGGKSADITCEMPTRNRRSR
ncbi:acyl-CoA reductase-like NAD-dependent aldehyde dehydrogenase [Lipingzhangella halophila]|uniref:Acyl-CoA reductase-like NAD-dependent aldehyde dehydrogenase n=2 Tax=Lipingzhangella halophila TaxID=1783352 RepID=A0A7W7W1F9_9ACTN|nr:acyl-CoA reductase-like NAD-dependent aldehyde dehydrogenase [Lipingzhangella halophila]